MLSADLLCTERADARASAHKYTVVVVIPFGCFGGWWVQSNFHQVGSHILCLGEEQWKVRVPHSQGCAYPAPNGG
jgi:hypothetical protein